MNRAEARTEDKGYSALSCYLEAAFKVYVYMSTCSVDRREVLVHLGLGEMCDVLGHYSLPYCFVEGL